jgi:hypothetical protein
MPSPARVRAMASTRSAFPAFPAPAALDKIGASTIPQDRTRPKVPAPGLAFPLPSRGGPEAPPPWQDRHRWPSGGLPRGFPGPLDLGRPGRIGEPSTFTECAYTLPRNGKPLTANGTYT